MENVFIVSAVRTPIGKNQGYLREYTAPELLGLTLDEVVQRIDLDPGLVDDVITGTVYQVGEQGATLARMGILASENFPITVPGISINRQCGSGLSAIQMAAAMISSGAMDVMIASGCEMLSKYTIQADLNGTLANGNPMGNPYGDFYLNKYGHPDQMLGAQLIADKWEISKEDCQAFAVQSHQRAYKATINGYFENEIMPMAGVDKEGSAIVMKEDETIRPQTTMEKLNELKVLPNTKFITAGVSSTITDGASAVVLMSESRLKELKLTPLARVVASAVSGSDPKLMLTGPIYATPKVLNKAGLSMNDMDLYEINEAFAPIPLAWLKTMDADPSKLNVNGGAIALGHPVGNSGCRIVVSAINELKRVKGRYALVSLCTGGGMAPASIFERV